MKIVAIVQARMGSTRLPGKVLMDLAGQTVLECVVRRTQLSRLVREVRIATTTLKSDDPILNEGLRLGVPVSRGSEEDVLDRYWQASQECGATAIVRITSDCPLIDPEVIDQTIQVFHDRQADYACNCRPRTYPRGLDAEVFTADALGQAWEHAQKPHEREHVTPYFYENPGLFRLASLKGKTDYSQFRWTLDTPEDLMLLRAIYARFPGRTNFSWREAIELVKSEPALSSINQHVRQKQLQET